MANPTHIQEFGNQLAVLFDDGSKALAYPTVGGLWFIRAQPPTPVGEFRFPFPRADITFASYFGHSGVDWPKAEDTPIMAAGPGTVIDVNGAESWAGNYVTIDHGTIGGIGIWTLYAHMVNYPPVSVNDIVAGGEVIGYVGDSGQSEGNHLHFEVIYNGSRLPASTPGNNVPGLGFTRTLEWMDANTDGSSW